MPNASTAEAAGILSDVRNKGRERSCFGQDMFRCAWCILLAVLKDNIIKQFGLEHHYAP